MTAAGTNMRCRREKEQFMASQSLLVPPAEGGGMGFFMIRILLTEDNEDYRKLLKIHLVRAGYQVLEAGNGAQALDLIGQEPVDLLIADLMMPEMDGFELMRELRSANYNLPILIVSARTTIDDKREGFRDGADDYMTKPIDMDELLLRVEALLRRAKLSGEHQMTVAGCVLDEEQMTVTWQGESIELRQKEFYLLYKLLAHPGKIFTRQNLMDDIWGFDTETDPRTVDVHIRRLREKLAHIPGFEIQTIRGLGYKAVVKK